jgi:hypothetical protein
VVAWQNSGWSSPSISSRVSSVAASAKQHAITDAVAAKRRSLRRDRLALACPERCGRGMGWSCVRVHMVLLRECKWPTPLSNPRSHGGKAAHLSILRRFAADNHHCRSHWHADCRI